MEGDEEGEEGVAWVVGRGGGQREGTGGCGSGAARLPSAKEGKREELRGRR